MDVNIEDEAKSHKDLILMDLAVGHKTFFIASDGSMHSSPKTESGAIEESLKWKSYTMVCRFVHKSGTMLTGKADGEEDKDIDFSTVTAGVKP